MKLFLKALILTIPFSVCGEDLHFYQKIYRERNISYPSADEVSESLRTRLGSLRDQLGFSNLQINLLDSKGNAISYPVEGSPSHRMFSSTFFKRILERTMEEIRNRNRGDLPAFNPGWTERQQQEFLLARMKETYDVVVGPQFENILNELFAAYVESQKSQGGTLRQPTNVERELTENLAAYIEKNQPKMSPVLIPAASKDERETSVEHLSIEKNLGRLLWAESFDGYVTRLHFRQDVSNAFTVSISLPMLVTFRSGEDHLFVTLLHILKTDIESKLKEFYVVETDKNEDGEVEEQIKLDKKGNPILRKGVAENDPEFKKTKWALQFIEEKYFGAIYANHRLMSLLGPKPDPMNLRWKQIDFLIDLLIQLRGNDFLSEMEVTPFLQGVQREVIPIEETNRQIAERNKKLPPGKREELITHSNFFGLPISQINSDAVFYKNIHDHVYKLEEVLRVEASENELAEELIREQRERYQERR